MAFSDLIPWKRLTPWRECTTAGWSFGRLSTRDKWSRWRETPWKSQSPRSATNRSTIPSSPDSQTTLKKRIRRRIHRRIIHFAQNILTDKCISLKPMLTWCASSWATVKAISALFLKDVSDSEHKILVERWTIRHRVRNRVQVKFFVKSLLQV